MRRLLIASVLYLLSSTWSHAQSTAFTYQGDLKANGTPASGVHDFRFRLFDAVSGGAAVGSLVCADNVSVAEGKFSAAIDFGQAFATTAGRFLEIEVRRDTGLNCGSASGFAVLTPRQRITAAPFATHANTSGSAATAFSLSAPGGALANAVVVDGAGLVGVGTSTPGAKLHVSNGDLLAGAPGEEWIFHTRSSFGGDFLHITDRDAGVPQFQRGLQLDRNGNVFFRNLNSTVLAAGGDENLRILRGVVAATGAIVSGSGFTIENPFPGQYRIVYTIPFLDRPSVTITPDDADAVSIVFQTFQASNSSTRVLVLRNGAQGVNRPFQFTAIGRR